MTAGLNDADRACLACGQGTEDGALMTWRDADGEGHWMHVRECATPGANPLVNALGSPAGKR